MSGGIVCGKCFIVSDPGRPAPTCQLSYCPGAAERDRGRALFAKLATPEIVRCDGCDNGLERGWTYCAYCGRRVEAEDAA